jgi:hypothetical protein
MEVSWYYSYCVGVDSAVDGCSGSGGRGGDSEVCAYRVVTVADQR